MAAGLYFLRAEAGGETHVKVDEAVCFTCHFKGAEKGQAVTGCLVCHGCGFSRCS